MLNNTGASAKLYMLIFITAASLIGLGLYCIIDLKKMTQNTYSLYADRVLPIQQLSDIRFEYAVEIIGVTQKVKNHNLTFSEAKNRIEKAQKNIDANWHAYKLTYLTPEETVLVKQTDVIKDEADKACQSLLSILTKQDARALDEFISKKSSVSQAAFLAKLLQLTELQVRVGKELFVNNNQIYHTTTKNFIFIILTSLAIALSLSFYLIRNIKNLIENILISNNSIKESEEKYHSLFEQASDAIYVVNFNGYFTHVNESMCKMVGYCREELLKMNVADLVNDELLKINPLIYTIAKPGELITGERKIIHKDGSIIDIEVNGKKFADNRVILILRDITERKRMEAELRTTEHKFRTLADKSMVGVYISQKNKSEKNAFVYVNQRFAEIFGYEDPELIGTTAVETIIHPDYRDVVRENIRVREEQGIESIHYEVMGVKKDGSTNWVEFYGTRTLLEDVPTFIGSVIDITERKKIETELQTAEIKFRTLAEKSVVGVYIAQKDKYIYLNQRFADIFGYEPAELMAAHPSQSIIHPDYQNTVYEKIRLREEEKVENVHYEAKGRKKDGTSNWVEIYASITYFEGVPTFIGTVIDITDRKEMEAELRIAELKYRTLADKSMVGIYIVQKEKYVYVNQRFAEVFGYHPHELIGNVHPVEAIIHPDYQAITMENVRLRETEEVESVHYETMGRRKDGSSNWVEFYGSRIFFEDEPTYIGSMVDITERKLAEQELKASEEKYRLLFESNPVPLWIVAKDDLSVIAVNEAAANLYGYTKEELLNTSIKRMRPPEDVGEQSKVFQEQVDNTTDFGIVRHVKKDGTHILVNIISQDIVFEGRVVRLSSTNDITEKIKAEELLKKTEANLQTILNTNDTAYALLDRDLNILEYNNKALTFVRNEFDFGPESSGKIFDRLPEHKRESFFKYINDVLNGNTISYETFYKQPDGTNIWYHIRMFPISNSDNEILGLVLAISDITPRKNAEESLQTAYDQIKANLNFIREMVWKQSHILRSPVANLKGLITILGMDPSDREVMSYIETELERMDIVFSEMAADSVKEEMSY